MLGFVFGIAAFWIFLTIIGRMPPQRLVLYAVGLTVLIAATVAFSVLSHDEPPRAGAAGVAALAAAVTLQRGLLWYHAALLALVPLAVRLPVPQRSAVGQAIVALVYALAVAGGVCALVWMR